MKKLLLILALSANTAMADDHLDGPVRDLGGRLTTAEGTLDAITDGSRGTGEINVLRAEIGNALIGSAQFSPTGSIHINGRQTQDSDGEFTTETQVNINKMHVNFNGGKSGGFTSQGNYANIIARDIPTNGLPPQALEEGTGMFVRKEFLILQSISKANGQQTRIDLRDDQASISLNEGDGIVASSVFDNESANLYYTSDNWSSYSAISATDNSAKVQVTDAGGNTTGMMATHEGTELTGGTTTMLLDDNGVTLSNDGADVQLHGVANGIADNDAVNVIQLDQATGKNAGAITSLQEEDTALGERIGQERTDRSNADIAISEHAQRNTDDLADETLARETADGLLDGRITTNTGDITSLQEEDTVLHGRINNIAAGGEANAALIDDETTARIAGDDALGERIGQERTDRSNADIAISEHAQRNTDDLADETLARETADTVLHGRIDDEKATTAALIRIEADARETEDTAINVRVDTNVTDIGVNRTRITTNTGNIAANHSRILNLASDFQRLDRTLRGGIASVAALGMITSAPAPGKRFSLGMGVGNYRGENAAALGFTGRVTDSILVKAGVGFNNGTYTAAGGIIYSW